MPRARRWISGGVLFGILGSVATHGSIVLAFLLLFLSKSAAGVGEGNGGGAGENGNTGAGDTDIDVSLAAPAAVATAAATETIPTPPSPVTPQPVIQQKAEPNEVGDLPPLPQQIPSPIPHADSANGHDQTTNGGRLPGPTRIGPVGPGGGSGGDSIEGQRALLPKAAVCTDPVTGFWEALKYSPIHGNWVHFKLTVNRHGTAVSGTIISRTWSGGPRDSVPTGCEGGGYDLTVSMNATGNTNGETITFGSSHVTIIAEPCPLVGQYVPDSFSGTIDGSRQEFQSLNNDGFVDINVPYVFRRTRCLDE